MGCDGLDPSVGELGCAGLKKMNPRTSGMKCHQVKRTESAGFTTVEALFATNVRPGLWPLLPSSSTFQYLAMPFCKCIVMDSNAGKMSTRTRKKTVKGAQICGGAGAPFGRTV